MEPIRVVVHGALGKLGREVVNGLCLDPEAQLVGAVDLKATGGHLSLPDESGTVPISADLRDILSKCQADVLADFTIANESSLEDLQKETERIIARIKDGKID